MWNGDSPTQQTDLYALGVILYELLTGCLPFPAETPASLMKMHLTDTPEPPSSYRPDLPFWADLLVQKLLAKELEDRPRSVDVVIQTLDTPPRNPVSKARRGSNPPMDAPLKKRPPTDNGVNLSDELRRTLTDDNPESDGLMARLSNTGLPSIGSAPFTSANSLKSVDLRLEGATKPRSSSMKFIMRAFGGESSEQGNPFNVRGRSLRMMMKEGKPTLYPEDAEIQMAPPTDFAMPSGGSGTMRTIKSSGNASKAITVMLLVVCIITFIGVLAFPHYSYLFRKQKQEPLALLLADGGGELNAVEHFVALYRKDFLRADAFLFHYQAFQTELKILFPGEEMNFRREETPEGPSVLILTSPPPGER